MNVAVWLGNAPPVRSVRWLDGALATASAVGSATAIAAGEEAWLDLAHDRAARAGIRCVGVTTALELDYLGWAQIVAATARRLDARTVIVDEVSRRGRFAEVAAIAELLDVSQLTQVVSLASDGDVLHASRTNGRLLQSVRIRGAAVIGVRIAGPALRTQPKSTPGAASDMDRFDLPALALDALVLGQRAVPPRATSQTRKIDRVADHVALHRAQRIA